MSNNDLLFEIQWREKLLSSLSPTLTTYNKHVTKERQAAMERQAEIRKLYPTPEDAHEAFGYGNITEDEYREIAEQLESVNITVYTAARDELKSFMSRLRREIKDFTWESTPKEEKERIRANNEQYKQTLIAQVNKHQQSIQGNVPSAIRPPVMP